VLLNYLYGGATMDGFLLDDFPFSCTTESECEDYLIRLRWADGFNCPRCDHDCFYKIKTRKLYECRECRTQVSVTAGTVMHRSKLSLLMWFRVIHLLASSDKVWTASSLAEQLDINYRTARLILNKLKWALEKKIKFSGSRREKESQLIEQEKLHLMQGDSWLLEQGNKDEESTKVSQERERNEDKQASEKEAHRWAELIHKLNDKCIVLQKEKLRMNRMNRAHYMGPGLRGNSPSELITSWMRAFLSVSLYPNSYW
jgi:transposase-like protein